MEKSVLNKYAAGFDRKKYLELNQEMSYEEYIALAIKNPKITRNAFQYVYDMIVSKGTSEFERYRKTYTHYNFFDNPKITIFGLEETLDSLVNFIHGAAGGYGTEKRVLLLHGPVGSAKSTICRLLKKGLEEYSRTKDGAWYSYKWVNLPTEGEFAISTTKEDPCPLHEEPSRLMDEEQRAVFLSDVNASLAEQSGGESPYTITSEGEMCPRCKTYVKALLKRYDGDWNKVVSGHIRVVRLVHSEIDRIGVGTFQPKDEKNQDSTELTGDLNFGKVGHYGSDSDSRAFNFDGELCVSNRGIMEFIEMLKLSNEFLYDLLGASQEHNIKPKKFSQVKIDEVIIGHSVHGGTPIPHEYNGVLNILPIEELSALDPTKLRVFSVNVKTRQVELSGLKKIFSHDFGGEWVESHQDGDVVTTTPNHSIYNKNYETFFPAEEPNTEMLSVDIPQYLTNGLAKSDKWVEVFGK